MTLTATGQKNTLAFAGEVTLVAAEAIEVGDLVTATGYKADANADRLAEFIALQNAASAAPFKAAKVVVIGNISGGAGAGTPVYLSDTAGDVSETPSTTFNQPVGVELTSTTALLFLGQRPNTPMHIAIVQTSATPGTHRAIYGKETTFTTMTSGNLVGVRGEVSLGGNVTTVFLYGAQGKIITGAHTINSVFAYVAGVFGQLDVSGGTLTAGKIAGLVSDIFGANSGSYSAVSGVYVEHAGGGVIDSFLKCLGKSDYVFNFASNAHVQMSTTGTVTDDDGWLKVLVEGSVRYIGLGATVS